MKATWILVAAMTLCLSGLGCSLKHGKDEEKDEVKVTMDQLPAAVKATLQKEAGSGKIVALERETRNGQTVYEADVSIDGKTWEIVIGEDGRLISKKIDDD